MLVAIKMNEVNRTEGLSTREVEYQKGRETEKAVCLIERYRKTKHNGDVREEANEIWIPKSQVFGEWGDYIFVKEWIIREKAIDVDLVYRPICALGGRELLDLYGYDVREHGGFNFSFPMLVKLLENGHEEMHKYSIH